MQAAFELPIARRRGGGQLVVRDRHLVPLARRSVERDRGRALLDRLRREHRQLIEQALLDRGIVQGVETRAQHHRGAHDIEP
ncbi:MAG: hypothetical protein NAOJABEB_03233 [Steroidobacteraceae bacterium]|nr:hypothetical protein [Steroidobacteraceae bacterium]